MCVYKIKVYFKLQANLGKVFKGMKAKVFLVLNQKKIPQDPPKFSNVVSSVLNNILEINSEMCFTGHLCLFVCFNISQ